jgi:diaminopimelate decarboxylase
MNPHVMAGGNTIFLLDIDSKFGICSSVCLCSELLKIQNEHQVFMHTGSDILDIEVFLYAAKYYLMLPKISKQFLDFGISLGNFLYKRAIIETDIEELEKTIKGFSLSALNTIK